MPEEIQDTLNRAAGALPPVEWLEPSELRSRAQRHRRRRTVVAVFATVLVLGGAAGVADAVVRRVPPSVGGPTLSCPDGLVSVNLALPPADEVRLTVLNATTHAQLASTIADQLRNRGFRVSVIGNFGDGETLGGVAVLRYGPAAVGAAWLMRSYFRDQATMEFVPERPDAVVDVILGSAFRNLASPTEVNRWIAALGRPQAPAGTCGLEQEPAPPPRS